MLQLCRGGSMNLYIYMHIRGSPKVYFFASGGSPKYFKSASGGEGGGALKSYWVVVRTLFMVPILSTSSLSSFRPSTRRENSSALAIPVQKATRDEAV